MHVDMSSHKPSHTDVVLWYLGFGLLARTKATHASFRRATSDNLPTPTYLPAYLPIYLSIYLSTRLSTQLFTHLSIHLSTHLSAHMQN